MKNVKTEKIDKGKETVTRILDFSCNVTEEIKVEQIEKCNGEEKKAIPVKENGCSTEKIVEIKREPIENEKPLMTNGTPVKTEEKSTENDEKSDVKKSNESSSKHSSSSSKSHHHSSSSHRHSSSSSHHKSSHRSSSSKDCSRCYRRSKIKKVNAGVQTRNELPVEKKETRDLEFEASHRVGINRQPISIKTNMKYLKYGRFYHIEVYPNGGASIVHMYQDELDTLKPEEMSELVDEFFELVFSEDEDGFAYHVMGVVHDSARYLPDMLEHLAESYSTLTVKSGVIGRNNDIETCSVSQYYDQVCKNYDEGTIRYGPLHQISLVGKVHEEVGGYFPDLLGQLEQNPFLKKAMPWGKLSIVQMDPRLSNDGPILWIRPGEQLIPTADMKTPSKRSRARINELRNLQYLPRSSEAREIMFEDRTKAHADHVGMGHERQTTAAVGM
jgi:lysine-specific demethylase 9